MTAPPPKSRFAAYLFAFAFLSLLTAPAVRADPVLGVGTGLTATVTWSMNDSAGLRLDNVTVEGQSAVLAWAPREVNWSKGSNFKANGTLDPGLVAGPSGIELASDARNYIADGDFSAPGSWQLSPTQNVSVVEELSPQDAYLGHVSSASPQTEFNSMDTVDDPNWTNTGSSGSTCSFVWVTPDHDGGGNMIQCTVTLGSPPGSYAGIEWPGANWSAFDRLLLWVFAENPSPLTWSFQMSAVVNTSTVATTAQPLSVGWQEISVDLTEFGPDRSALSSIRFLVVGRSIFMKNVDFDDVRLTRAKSFNETGRLRQSFAKANATSTSLGSASFAFDYQVVNHTDVDRFGFAVNLSSSGGTYATAIPVASPGPWTHYSTDVSSLTGAAGIYTLEFSVRITVNGTVESNASVRIDNVGIEFPNRSAGGFLSRAIDLGSNSQFLAVQWSAVIPQQTNATLKLRSGNESDTNGPSWSGWSTWSNPGTYSLAQGPSRFLEVRLDLNTSNASRTPLVDSVYVGARHRSLMGSIEATYTATDSSFREWSSMAVQTTIPGGTSLSVLVDRGNGWYALPTGGSLSQASARTISWRVVLGTSNGSATPQLRSVVLTFALRELPPNLATIFLSPFVLVLASLLAIVLGYSVFVVIRRGAFAVDDLFLISREGRLILHNTRRMRPDRDEDIFSGMTTAILAFIKDSDPEGNGELRHFKVGDRTTVLEKGAHSYVAAVYSGRVPRWSGKDLRRFMLDVETRFGAAIADWSGDPEDLQGLKELSSRFVSHVRYRSPRTASRRAA